MNLEKEIFDISLQDIIPNRFQPREIFNDAELNELAESIKQHGVIQPIIVRKVGDKYEIIAGERRFRASQLAGQATIPALVRDIDDKEAAKIALLENLQRSNLTPIEEAKTYQTILKIDNITQDELAQNLGKSQSTIANKLRLLSLNEEVQTALLNSQISERHARSLIGLDDNKQIELLQRIINEKLTVRQLDEEVAKITGNIPTNNIDSVVVPNQNEGEITMNTETLNDAVPTTINNINNQIPSENMMPTIDQTNTIPEINNEIPEQPVINENIELAPSIKVEQPKIPEAPIMKESPQHEENIFDKLRVIPNEPKEEKLELKTPDLSSVISNNEQNSFNQNEYNNIYDLRFAINNFRQAIQNTEKFGFKVTANEYDKGDKYQIVIEIDKKN